MYHTDGMIRKQCPKCDKKMVMAYMDGKTSNFWCGCGYQETSSSQIDNGHREEKLRRMWELVNGGKSDSTIK